MQPDCSVRVASIVDLQFVSVILSDSFKLSLQKVLKEVKDRLQSDNHICLVAIADRAIVGVVELAINSNYLYLFSLAVLPRFRNQGAATQLLKEAAAIAWFLEVKNIYLHVTLDKKLLQFYLKLGYQFCRVDLVNGNYMVLLENQKFKVL